MGHGRRKRRITARRGRFLAHQSCRCPCGARLVNPPGGCYMTAPPKVPVSVPTEAHSAHRGTYQSRDPPPRTAASCYLYGVACLQNACRKMRGGAPSTTAGSTPVPRPPPGVLWVGSNRPWRARVAIYHPRRAAPLGAWAGPCAAVYMEFHCGRCDLPKRRLPPKTHFGGKALPPPPPPYKIHSNRTSVEVVDLTTECEGLPSGCWNSPSHISPPLSVVASTLPYDLL